MISGTATKPIFISRTLNMGNSYNFHTNPDPLIEFLCSEIRGSGIPITRLAERARVNPNTISKILEGKVLRPRHSTLNQIAFVLGLKFEVAPTKVGDPEPPDYRAMISSLRNYKNNVSKQPDPQTSKLSQTETSIAKIRKLREKVGERKKEEKKNARKIRIRR